MRKLITKIEIEAEDGKNRVRFESRDNYIRMLQYLKPGEYDLRIEPHKNRRSISHNAYYWGACGYVAKKLSQMGCEGWTSEDIHELSKAEINSVVKLCVGEGGEIIEKKLGGATREMTPEEFAEYAERFKRYWAQHHVSIPDEYWQED